jgi:ankyrin repeat protein
MSTKITKDRQFLDFHEIAKKGHFYQIPFEYITQENLTTQNFYGDTPLHCAARNQHLNQIPLSILTEKNLSIQDNNGWTAFHWAAKYGNLNQIHQKLLTEKNLTLKANDGQTPIEQAALNLYLIQIPYPILIKHKKICQKYSKGEEWETLLEVSKNLFNEKIKNQLSKKSNIKI